MLLVRRKEKDAARTETQPDTEPCSTPSLGKGLALRNPKEALKHRPGWHPPSPLAG